MSYSQSYPHYPQCVDKKQVNKKDNIKQKIECVAWAKENNVNLITEKEMDEIQDKRNKEKKEK